MSISRLRWLAIASLTIAPTTASAEAPAPGIVATDRAPAALGPYSQAIDAGTMVFVSGQLGLNPAANMVSADAAAQTRQALRNIAAILDRAGLTLDDVAQTQVFVADLTEFPAINEAYASFFKRPPARLTVEVARLPRDGRVEISAIAIRAGARK